MLLRIFDVETFTGFLSPRSINWPVANLIGLFFVVLVSSKTFGKQFYLTGLL
jgi:hypothetical protein